MPDQFVIEELTGTDPIKVTLEEHELPFGRPRRGGAFDVGGPVNHDKIYLDGRIPPIIHAKQPQFHPVHIHSHFRDRFKAEPDRAWGFVQQLEQMRQNMRLLSLTWWKLTWTAFMADGRFPVEGTGDFTYEIRFEILSGPSTKPYVDDDRLLRLTSSPADLAAETRAMFAADRAAMLAVFLSRISFNVVDDAFANVDTALGLVEDAAASFESAPARADAEGKRLIGRAEEAKSRCDDLQAQLDNLNVTNSASATASGTAAALASVLTSPAADAEAAYWAWLYAAAADVLAGKDNLRKMQYTARQRINATKKLYVVADGDTLERIALANGLPASKANDLGYTAADLKVGRTLRIPIEV